MINIKRFVDRIASLEGRQAKDLILPLSEAKLLRDEITRLLVENKELSNTTKKEEVIEVKLVGNKW
jgi:hypothetical protein